VGNDPYSLYKYHCHYPNYEDWVGKRGISVPPLQNNNNLLQFWQVNWPLEDRWPAPQSVDGLHYG